MTILEKKQQFIEELSVIDDPYERFGYVIDLGKDNPPLDEEYKKDSFKIDGCTSNLWLVPEHKEGKCWFKSDSDSQITKGIAALLCELYSGYSAEDVLSLDPAFLGDVGVTQHLSHNRRNGLTQICNKIFGFAKLYTKEQ